MQARVSSRDGFHGTFTRGIGEHYITMLPADWSICTHNDDLVPSGLNFYSETAVESIYRMACI